MNPFLRALLERGGVYFDQDEGGSAGGTNPTPGQQPPASPPTQGQQPAQTSGEEDLNSLPTWAQKLVKDLRKEAGDHRRKLRDKEDADQKAEADRLAKQGEFEKLYQAEKTAREKLEAQITEMTTVAMRQKIVNETGLPAALAERLQGSNEDEMRADALKLKEALGVANQPGQPGNPAPGAQRNTTTIPGGRPSGKTDAEIKEWMRGGASVGGVTVRQEGERRVYGGT